MAPVDESLAVDSTREVLREALRLEVPVLGICLGAELLAEAAGGHTYPCRAEWGYCEVTLEPAASEPTLEMLDGWTRARGHVMEANGVDPEATRSLGRRYVPEWREHAAAIARRFAAALRTPV